MFSSTMKALVFIAPALVGTSIAAFAPGTITKKQQAADSSPSRRWQSQLDDPPTPEDVDFDNWCDRNGIFRIPGIQTVTTPRSVGGRGLFTNRDLKCGTVMASIPADVILSSASDNCWQVDLTRQVWQLLSLSRSSSSSQDNNNHENDQSKQQQLQPWIQSWESSADCLPMTKLLLQNKEEGGSLDDGDTAVVVGNGAITGSGLQAEVRERMDRFRERLPQILLLGEEASTMKQQQEVAMWYSLVMSRSCYLGEDWDYKAGCVPFFDMLNHSNDANLANVELQNFGRLLRQSSSSSSSTTEKESNISNIGLNPKDLVLVLTKDVAAGEELLTQYETDVENNEENQLKLWIQYGIPPPST